MVVALEIFILYVQNSALPPFDTVLFLATKLTSFTVVWYCIVCCRILLNLIINKGSVCYCMVLFFSEHTVWFVTSPKAIHTHGPLYSSSIRPSQQNSLFYTQFSRIHLYSLSPSIHSIYYETYLSFYLNISMYDLVFEGFSFFSFV
jgi:hypothetical protein